MSVLGTRISASARTQCLAGSSRSVSAPCFVQTRGIQRRAARKKMDQKQRHKQNAQQLDAYKEESWKKPVKATGGTFFPMSANQLKQPIFESDKRTSLDLPLFVPKALTPDATGTAMQFTHSEHDILKAYGVPRKLLVEFRLLSKPCAVVRDITYETITRLEAVSGSSSQDTRAVLTGPRGCGKSVLLLQAVEYCANKGWVVLYIPRAINLVNSSTQYIYDPRTRTYLQPAYSSQLLRRFAQINNTALQSLKTTKEFVHEQTTVRSGTPLIKLIEFATETEEMSSPAVLEAVLASLADQKSIPVLLAVDDVQALYNRTSLYRNPRFEGINPHHLSLPRLLLQYFSGKKVFQKGTVLGALSCSDTRFTLPLELREALGIPHDRPSGPYVRRRAETVEYAKGLKNIPVPAQLKVNEAASLFEVWMQDKALHSPLTDETFMTTYTQAAGNAREFVWKGLLGSFTL